MTTSELIKFFYEDPPIILKGLQDIIGLYAIDVFDMPLTVRCVGDISGRESRTVYKYHPFECHTTYIDERKDEYIAELVKIGEEHYDPEDFKYESIDYIKALVVRNEPKYYTEEEDVEMYDDLTLNFINNISTHIQKVFKGPTYSVKIKDQDIIFTKPFFVALVQWFLYGARDEKDYFPS